jgi:disulfide bond formation protein DsbB
VGALPAVQGEREGADRAVHAEGPLTHDVTVALSVLGVIGQALVVLFALLGFAWLVGLREPLDIVRGWVEGYELWLAFLVSAIATGGSLFFSEIANYVPCELCWFQRICMYPLSIITLLAALRNDTRIARYLLPLPILGAGISIYHLLVENGVVEQSKSCLISAPGGCATKWINEFGYMTIPTLALTGFLLVLVFLLMATFERADA